MNFLRGLPLMKTLTTARWEFTLMPMGDNGNYSWYAKTLDLDTVDNIEIVCSKVFSSKNQARVDILQFVAKDGITNFRVN